MSHQSSRGNLRGVLRIGLVVIVGTLLSAANSTANPRFGVVNTQRDSLNLRAGPGTNYPLIGKLLQDEKVTIVDSIGEWYQVKVERPNLLYRGYVSRDYIAVLPTVVEFTDAADGEFSR